MKIVQFKNGKYGVRRRDPAAFWTDVQFLSRSGWWNTRAFASVDNDYSFDTIQEAQAIIKKSENDKGKPVKL